MRIDGEWYVCADGIVRPAIMGRIRSGDGSLYETYFLLDTGADRTVLSGAVLRDLGLPSQSVAERLSGLGGTAETVAVETELYLPRENSGEVILRGRYHAVIDPEALDLSVLGRDITGLFALIVDGPGKLICLLGQRHGYRIVQS